MDAADGVLSYRKLESIAEKLGINKGTVENQLTHALHAIRMNMEEYAVQHDCDVRHLK